MEWRDIVSSVWLERGLAIDALFNVLLRLDSLPRSRIELATNDAGREVAGVLFLVDIRLSSGLGLAGGAG